MGIHRPRQAVGDRRDEVSQRAAFRQPPRRIGADLLRPGVGAVDGRAHTAHQHQPPLQPPLQGRDVIFRQHALPHLNADLRHVLHDGGQIGVGVVDGDAATGPDIPVKPAVRLLEKRPPHLRLHEQRVLCAPVVVGKDDVRLQPVDQQLHIAQPVLGDVFDQLVHLLRMLVEVGQCVLKAHQKVALLKNARSHEARQQLLLPAGLPRLGPALLPALGTVGRQLRRMDRLPPPRHIGAYRQTVAGEGHRPGRVRRKADGGAPPVHADGPPLPVAPQIGVDGVRHAHLQRLILPQLPVRLPIGLQKRQKVLSGCHHRTFTSQGS